MRIWDISVECLCRQHLLGEHRELHAMWTVLTTDKKGYRNHPETQRWVGKLNALYQRHEQQVREMTRRGYSHHSPLDKTVATGETEQVTLITPVAEQIALLEMKGCECAIVANKATPA